MVDGRQVRSTQYQVQKDDIEIEEAKEKEEKKLMP